MAVTHDHSSPYYSSPSWGVWAFQDVFDIRFYDYYAQRIADGGRAGRRATCSPVRVGAARHARSTRSQRNSLGPVGRRRRHAGRLPERRHRPRHDRRALRRRLEAAKPNRSRRSSTTALHPRDARGQRPDLRRLGRPAPADGRPRDRRRSPSSRRTRSAPPSPSASTLPLVPRAARVHAPQYAQAERAARLLADAAAATWRRIGDGAPDASPRYAPTSSPWQRLPGDDGRPLVPRPGVAPVPERVELPHRPDASAGNPQAPSSACPTARAPAAEPPSSEPPVDPGLTTDDLERARRAGARELRRRRLHAGSRRTSASTSRRSASATCC